MESVGSRPYPGNEPSLRIWASTKLMKNPPDRLLHPSIILPCPLYSYLNLQLPGLTVGRKVTEKQFKVKCNQMVNKTIHKYYESRKCLALQNLTLPHE